MAVGQDVEALDALGHKILRVPDDLLIGALQDAGAAGDLAHKGQILHAVLPQQLGHGVVVERAHEIVEAAVDGGPRAVKAGGLVIGDNFKEGLFARLLHLRGEFLHLVLGQSDIFEAPMLYRQVAARFKSYFCLLHGNVVMGKHDHNIRSHFLFLLFQK